MGEFSDPLGLTRGVASEPKANILLVDDNPANLLSLRAILEDVGGNLVEARSGEEALRRVQSEDFAVVLLDVHMPGISGYAVAREIRKMFAESGCPLLVAISGKWLGQTDKMLAEVAGFHHFLRKPCDPSALLQLLEPLKESAPLQQHV